MATIGPGGVTVIDPESGEVEHVAVGDDPLTTNICFGGADMQTAYITLSTTGRLISCRLAASGSAAPVTTPRLWRSQ